MRVVCLGVPLLVITALLASAERDSSPFGAWRRVSNGPVIAPQGDGWESAGTFNPAVVRHDGRIVMLYRAQDRSGISRLGYATSPDGIRFTRRPDPALSPEADYERDGGIEDPRLVKIDGTYYLTYTGYNKKDAQLCLATSTDLVHWDRKGVILPAYRGRWNVGWTKSGAIVPEKIDGKYWMYFLGTAADKTDQMGLAYSLDLAHWTDALDVPVLPRRPSMFDSRVVEPGPPPIVTSDAIVLIYNGADDALVYRSGVVRFDRTDPRRVLSRTAAPVFAPEADWEKAGQVPNVVFVEGMVRQDNRWLFYYGGADKYVGVAEAADGSAASTPPDPVVDDSLLLDHSLRINGLMPRSVTALGLQPLLRSPMCRPDCRPEPRRTSSRSTSQTAVRLWSQAR